ncbi:response regulator transcription factor [Anaerosoma tenue]|uniref:response regulator transcription factor n=1 Tax=Anaerosoma tenue TaxID=2933588 RepID=UPI002260A528|nr:response regulator transcription factor [Anaerosoma tenue]MCK8114942.1 response regulator transcription factor [Anaerosoma tenue]
MARALVVDDEANIRELVGLYLQSAGLEVEYCTDGAEAISRACGGGCDIVVLDIMLPSMDGIEVCRRIRERSDVPIIMLTAREGDLDKVGALETGADDYVTKPFSPPELVARVRALIRRAGTHAATSAPIRIGTLELDPATRDVSVAGSHVALTAREFDLLHALARQPGVVLTRRQLLEAAWGFAEYVDERGVDVHIRHIREKLGDDAAAPRFVETVRGVGYRAVRDS